VAQQFDMKLLRVAAEEVTALVRRAEEEARKERERQLERERELAAAREAEAEGAEEEEAVSRWGAAWCLIGRLGRGR
jgi:hypothetical protein